MSTHPEHSQSLEDILRQMPSSQPVETDSVDSLEALLRGAGQSSSDVRIEFVPLDPSELPDTEDLTPVQRKPESLLERMQALAEPEYDLGVAPTVVDKKRDDPQSDYALVEREINDRLLNGNHGLEPSEGVAFWAPEDSEPEAVEMHAPHEINFPNVAKEVGTALENIIKFDQEAEQVVESVQKYARQRFQEAVDAMFIRQRTLNWHAQGLERSQLLGESVLEQFEAFSGAREHALEAQAHQDDLFGKLSMRQSELRKYGIADGALNAQLERLRLEDRENTKRFNMLDQRYREITMISRPSVEAAKIKEEDIDLFELRNPAITDERSMTFENNARAAMLDIHSTAAADLRDKLPKIKAAAEDTLLAKGRILEQRIGNTAADLEQNAEAIQKCKQDIKDLLLARDQFRTTTYEPALRAMTESLVQLEMAIGLVNARSAQVSGVALQIESAQQHQLQQRVARDEQRRKEELRAIQAGKTPALESAHASRHAGESEPVDNRRIPAPEVIPPKSRLSGFLGKLGIKGLLK